MKELALPHVAPIRFAKFVISKEDVVAVVRNEFATVPTLGMLIEAVAQSSAALADDDYAGNIGYLTTLKNVKLLKKPSLLEFDIEVTKEQQLGNFGYFSFEVRESDEPVATGSYMVVLTDNKP